MRNSVSAKLGNSGTLPDSSRGTAASILSVSVTSPAQACDIETYKQLARQISKARYSKKKLVYTVGGESFRVPSRRRDLSPGDHELERLLPKEPSVALTATLGVDGELLGHGLRWSGPASYARKKVRVTFSYGEPVYLEVLSTRFSFDDGKPKVVERGALGGGQEHVDLGTDLNPKELLIELANHQQAQSRARAGKIVHCSIDGTTRRLCANDKKMGRLETLFTRALQTTAVTFEGHSSTWSRFKVYRLPLIRVGTQSPEARRFRAHYRDGEAVKLEILSSRFHHPGRIPKSEEIIDLKTGERSTELNVSELISMVRQSAREPSNRRQVQLAVDGKKNNLLLPRQGGDRFELLLGAQLQHLDRVEVFGTTASGGTLNALGLFYDAGKSCGDKAIQVRFKKGRPLEATIFSSRFFLDRDHKKPKVEEYRDLRIEGSARTTDLSFVELLEELENWCQTHKLKPGPHFTIRIGERDFELPAGIAAEQRLVFFGRDLMKREPELEIRGTVNAPHFLGFFDVGVKLGADYVGKDLRLICKPGDKPNLLLSSNDGLMKEVLDVSHDNGTLKRLWHLNSGIPSREKLASLRATGFNRSALPISDSNQISLVWPRIREVLGERANFGCFYETLGKLRERSLRAYREVVYSLWMWHLTQKNMKISSG